MNTDKGHVFRRHLFEKNNESDQNNLLKDIDIWGMAVPKNTPIAHHVGQFQTLCQGAVIKLLDEYNTSFDTHDLEDRALFITFMNGTLGSQWSLLRQLAQQRIDCHPYRKALEELDDYTASCYFRVRDALPRNVGTKISSSPPMVNLGFTANITLSSDNAPSVIGLPFGAMQEVNGARSDQITIEAIPHEVSHNVFEGIPGCMDELTQKFTSEIAKLDPPDKLNELIWQRILPWLNEMVADLSGTAIGGFLFAQSAYKLLATPIENVDVADQDHPIAVLRPWIHYWMLYRLIYEDPTTLKTPTRDGLMSQLDELEGDLVRFEDGVLQKRYRSTPDLAIVSFQQVKDQLKIATNDLLDIPLAALGGEALFPVLLRAWQKRDEAVTPVNVANLPKWGEDHLKSTPFIIKHTTPAPEEHSLPIMFNFPPLCLMGLKDFCQ